MIRPPRFPQPGPPGSPQIQHFPDIRQTSIFNFSKFDIYVPITLASGISLPSGFNISFNPMQLYLKLNCKDSFTSRCPRVLYIPNFKLSFTVHVSIFFQMTILKCPLSFVLDLILIQTCPLTLCLKLFCTNRFNLVLTISISTWYLHFVCNILF